MPLPLLHSASCMFRWCGRVQMQHLLLPAIHRTVSFLVLILPTPFSQQGEQLSLRVSATEAFKL